MLGFDQKWAESQPNEPKSTQLKQLLLLLVFLYFYVRKGRDDRLKGGEVGGGGSQRST